MTGYHIVLVEDDEDIQQLVEYNLLKEGFTVDCAGDGKEGLSLVLSENPDLLVLDLMLPGLHGLEVCRSLKKDPATAAIPIIILTAKGEESDILAGFTAGADDYVTKPFSPKVLLARIKAVLGRKSQVASSIDGRIRLHDLIIDAGRHEVSVGDQAVKLTFSEFKLLQLLASRPGWVFSRFQIVQAIHGMDYVVTDRAIDVQVAGLRKRLGEAGKIIETVRGVGYKLRD
ncbi:MAG: response regulator transcription factor [Candidatus Eisenbacteria bacterium]|uniref:Response regulator transcription factor n=1 Tax=Eiseniibacteriota bacterium TaxID=2212470 RepID=A0A948S0Q7_UNCEI|nr:response regulator transcription factor [Candidatus Eisenbacteria bacterium]MBU1951071.1 response regulator transcription factor [Candidatus Eisenbacteria bacterium]MBU2693208.1 response regulator transcription factor [Candidatus Eisenbacteria bacterium]